MPLMSLQKFNIAEWHRKINMHHKKKIQCSASETKNCNTNNFNFFSVTWVKWKVYCFHHDNVQFTFFDALYLRSWLLCCLTELSSIINDDDDDDDDDDGGGGGGGGGGDKRCEGIQS